MSIPHKLVKLATDLDNLNHTVIANHIDILLLKFANDTSYLVWASEKAKSMPGTSLKSKQELYAWLQEAIPVIVYKAMIDCHVIKICSTISPMFAKASVERGFPTLVQHRPGHVVNIVLTDTGAVEIDLSNIQFQWLELAETFEPTEHDPYGEQQALAQLINELKIDPFKAVKITELPIQPIDDGTSIVGKEELFNFDDARKYIKMKYKNEFKF